MNGFRENLTERLIGVNSHLNVYSFNEVINLDEINKLKINLDSKDYEKILPSIETQGLVINNKMSKGVIIRGYEGINSNHYLYDKIITKKLSSINFNHIIIGDALAKELKLQIGDKLKLAIPKTDKSLLGDIPRFKTLIISGIFDFGMYEYDSSLVFISLELSQKLLLFENNYFNRVEFYLDNPLLVDKFKSQVDLNIINKSLDLYSLSWVERNFIFDECFKSRKKCYVFNSYSNNRCRFYEHNFWFGNFC